MLKNLSELIGVSGGEHGISEFIKQQIENEVDEMIEDAYGNLIVRKVEGKEQKVLLTAHMDEVGFVITGIGKKGLLRFKTIGINPQVILAKKVVIGKHEIPGVIGHKPIHQLKDEEKKKIPEVRDLFIDIGVSTKEEAQKLIEIGALGTFDTQFNESDGIIYGKAFDNRVGCYILIQLIKTTDFPISYAFTVQEEVGLKGAQIVGHRVSPSITIAVDTTASGEWPIENDAPRYPEIGRGPVITIADRSVICDRNIVSLLEETAQENSIMYQFKKPMIGGTDAGAIHITKRGVKAAVVQTPARYIHSPLSIASRRDIEAGVELLRHSIQRILKEKRLWN